LQCEPIVRKADLKKQLAGTDLVADVHRQLLQVAIDHGPKYRVPSGHQGACDHKRRFVVAPLDSYHAHSAFGGPGGFVGHGALFSGGRISARVGAECCRGDEQ